VIKVKYYFRVLLWRKYKMARTVDFAKRLRKVAASLEELATAMESSAAQKKSFPARNRKSAPTRTRRSKKEVIALKKLLKAERKAGVPVAELAAKHGVSKPYIYALR
jgi:hypothetical protein